MRCKKILIGFGGSWFQTQEIDFVRDYVAVPGSLVIGAIINDLKGIRIHQSCGKEKCIANPACITKKAQRDRAKTANYLKQAGEEGGFNTINRYEQGTTLAKVLQETRFADLLVMSQQTLRASQRQLEGKKVSQLLTACECPVLVVPSQTEKINQVIITFDGSKEAMQGLKSFLYVLPEIAKGLPVVILATYQPGQELEAHAEKLFVEYLKQHFKEVALHRLNPETENTLIRAVGLNEQSLVIVNNSSPKELMVLHKALHPATPEEAPAELFTHNLR